MEAQREAGTGSEAHSRSEAVLGWKLWAQGQASSGWHLPHHPAWPLAVNTERTSSVSREIFISGQAVWGACAGLRVSFLRAGLGQEVRGFGSHGGHSVGPPKAGPGRACPEAPAGGRT